MDDAGAGADDHSLAPAVAAGFDGLLQVTSLSADARDEEVDIVADQLSDLPRFLRIGGPHHKAAIAVCVPVVSDTQCHHEVKREEVSPFTAPALEADAVRGTSRPRE